MTNKDVKKKYLNPQKENYNDNYRFSQTERENLLKPGDPHNLNFKQEPTPTVNKYRQKRIKSDLLNLEDTKESGLDVETPTSKIDFYSSKETAAEHYN